MSKGKQSISRPRSDRDYIIKKRRCLMCRSDFVSHWPGERVCPKCKSSHAWKDGADISAA